MVPSPARCTVLAETGCGIRCYQATRDLDRSSLYTAVYSGPVMPWIDPVKEAEAWKIQIRGGAATESDWVRAGGRNQMMSNVGARPKLMKPQAGSGI